MDQLVIRVKKTKLLARPKGQTILTKGTIWLSEQKCPRAKVADIEN